MNNNAIFLVLLLWAISGLLLLALMLYADFKSNKLGIQGSRWISGKGFWFFLKSIILLIIGGPISFIIGGFFVVWDILDIHHGQQRRKQATFDKIKLFKISEWQKNDCLFCSNPATLETRYKNAYIRCCENDPCKEQAKRLALYFENVHS